MRAGEPRRPGRRRRRQLLGCQLTAVRTLRMHMAVTPVPAVPPAGQTHRRELRLADLIRHVVLPRHQTAPSSPFSLTPEPATAVAFRERRTGLLAKRGHNEQVTVIAPPGRVRAVISRGREWQVRVAGTGSARLMRVPGATYRPWWRLKQRGRDLLTQKCKSGAMPWPSDGRLVAEPVHLEPCHETRPRPSDLQHPHAYQHAAADNSHQPGAPPREGERAHRSPETR